MDCVALASFAHTHRHTDPPARTVRTCEDNGGPTLTHALLPDSPARDAGDNADAPEWDQRGPGFPRVGNGVTDIGAFEVHAPVIIAQSPFRTLGPVASLRVRFDQAVDAATFTPDKITFFSGPLGDIPVTAVTVVPGSGGREFDIAFPAQFITSGYVIHLGPDIRDPAGTPTDHDRSGPPGESGDLYVGTFGIEGPRVLRGDPSGTAGGPVERVRVTFNTSMDPASFGPEDIYSWVGPLGGIGVLRIDVVPGSGDTEFDIVPLEPLTAAGSYELVLGPDVRDVWGNPMDQDDDLIAGEGLEDAFLGTFAIAGALPTGANTGEDAEELRTLVAALWDATTDKERR